MRAFILSCSLTVLTACGLAPGEQPAPTRAYASPSVPLTADPVRVYGKIFPVDEASTDPTFKAFRDSVIRMVGARDTLALFAILTPEVKLSFGGDYGRAGLQTIWEFDKPETQLWRTLDDVLHHGGRFAGESFFYAPYTFQSLPDSLDAFEHVIVRDTNALVYATPDSTTPPIARLDHDIVKTGEFAADPAWRTVLLTSGATAFVPERHIRSPIDYRIGFERIAGRWMISVFLAGD